ncbi:rod shape-determining protein MreD [Hufsiella ginkgonis]
MALLFFQVFLLKNMGYYNLATPFLYILFIMLLPFGIPNWLLFVLAFITGCTVDAFYDTAGVNAAACTVLAMVRVIFISITVQREGFDNEPEPNLAVMNFRWFFFYTFVLTIFHHTTLFLLETFNFDEIQYTITRILLSSAFTIVLILVYEFIFSTKKAR